MITFLFLWPLLCVAVSLWASKWGRSPYCIFPAVCGELLILGKLVIRPTQGWLHPPSE